MSKKIEPFYVLTILFFAQNFLAIANTKNPLTPLLQKKPIFTELQMTFKMGILSADLDEFVYRDDPNSFNPKNLTKLSTLNWDMHKIWTIGFTTNTRLRKFLIFVGIETAIPLENAIGSMQDYDFLNKDNQITHFSHHKTNLLHYIDAKTAVSYILSEKKHIRFHLGIGFNFQSSFINAYDGYTQYPRESNPPYSIFPQNHSIEKSQGNTVTYKQYIFAPFLLANFTWLINKRWELSTELNLAPYYHIHSTDNHLNRWNLSRTEYCTGGGHLIFIDSMNGFFSGKGSIGINFNMTDIQTLSFSVEGSFFHTAYGYPHVKCSTISSIYRTKGMSGSAYRSLSFSLAYSIRIR